MRLMIVESPTKAKKIGSILGSDWVVKASIGHIVDLPPHELGIAPLTYHLTYKLSDRGKDVIKGLKPLVQQADEIVLASDPDREGEAIAFHLRTQLGIEHYQRITFHEITEKGLRDALAAPRLIDDKLVHAQEARRAMDRLIGYKVSPRLSAQAGKSLSAGRCQSPAIRLVVERQNEIEQFKPTEHYGASISFDNGAWSAELDTTKHRVNDEPYLRDEALAQKAAACRSLTVNAATKSEERVAPAAPFTTSTLLQAAGEKLHFSAAQTQALAQKLFETGHITYHRTDSPNLDEVSAATVRDFAQTQGLPLCKKLRHWASAAGAQEAHGAIRPTHIECETAGETEPEQALYSLIRQRTIASQLEDAQFRVVTLKLVSSDDAKQFEFVARSRSLIDKGWMLVTPSDESPDDYGAPDEPLSINNASIPQLEKGASIQACAGTVLRKKTRAPLHFTETTLIRKLEQLGIGRPSTFAAIVTHLMERDYVLSERRYLIPQPAAYAIIEALEGRLSFLEYTYTKAVEDQLDQIATGKDAYLAVVSRMDQTIEQELIALDQMPPKYPCPACGKALHQITGIRGLFWGCTGYHDGCLITCEDVKGEPGEPVQHSHEPSEKAITFAKKLADDTHVAIPADTLASAKLLSVWIDTALKAEPPRMATEKQKAFIKAMIDKDNLTPPKAGIDTLTMKEASAFIDAHMHKAKAAAQ